MAYYLPHFLYLYYTHFMRMSQRFFFIFLVR
nr:MAG TPA: hypothetical protein [Caudoviricetes sp.]